MKLTKKIFAVVLSGALAVGSLSAFAEEAKQKPSFEITEEQKAEMLEKCKTHLKEMLDSGKITQEEYDASIQKIENGEFAPVGFGKGPSMGMGRGKGPMMGAKPGNGFGRMNGKGNFKADAPKQELTEEQKAEMKEKSKTRLKEMLDAGKITQEEYDAELENIENGTPTPMFGKGALGFKKPEHKEQSKRELTEHFKTTLKSMLDKGIITEEEYNTALENAEKGEITLPKVDKSKLEEAFGSEKVPGQEKEGFRPGNGFGRMNGNGFGKMNGNGFGGFKPHNNGFAKENKTLENAKIILKEFLDAGKITQEDYDVAVKKLETEEKTNRGNAFGKFKKPESKKAEDEVADVTIPEAEEPTEE